MNICFLDNTKFTYNSKHINSPILRGGETILLNLSKELYKQGHNITVINNCPKNETIDNIVWRNINHYKDNKVYDLAISNNDIKFFNKINAHKKVMISLSLQSFEKFIRKGQLLSYLKHKPLVALLGKYHLKNRPYYLRLYKHFIFDLSVDDIFNNTTINNSINSDYCIFTSRADRNMTKLIYLWSNKINPILKDKILITSPESTNKNVELYKSENILFRKMNKRNELIQDLLRSKICLIPGHKAELYCLAAEEARELCIPIVTLGIGSLSERVIHGKTGFIAKNDKEFTDYTINLFNDSNVWNDLRSNLLKLRSSKTWEKSALKFISQL